MTPSHNPLTISFLAELDNIKKIIKFLVEIEKITNNPETKTTLPHTPSKITSMSLEIQPSIPKMYAMIWLFISGMFENYIKRSFEDYCAQTAIKINSFSKLHKKFRASLKKYTAQIILDPEKHGIYDDQTINNYINTLSNNIQNNDMSTINEECLSTTYNNMNSSTLKELFERVGCKDITEDLSKQARVKTFFETDQDEKARSDFRTLLNDIMSKRNAYAHHKVDIVFPRDQSLLHVIDFFYAIAPAIDEIIAMKLASTNAE